MADDLVKRLQNYSAGCCGEYVPGRRCPACPHRIMDEAATRIRELEAERRWRPIETAPTDGTWIAGWLAYDKTIYRISWGRNHAGRLAWCTTFSAFAPGSITHWMPLPPAPEGK